MKSYVAIGFFLYFKCVTEKYIDFFVTAIHLQLHRWLWITRTYVLKVCMCIFQRYLHFWRFRLAQNLWVISSINQLWQEHLNGLPHMTQIQKITEIHQKLLHIQLVSSLMSLALKEVIKGIHGMKMKCVALSYEKILLCDCGKCSIYFAGWAWLSFDHLFLLLGSPWCWQCCGELCSLEWSLVHCLIMLSPSTLLAWEKWWFGLLFLLQLVNICNHHDLSPHYLLSFLYI